MRKNLVAILLFLLATAPHDAAQAGVFFEPEPRARSGSTETIKLLVTSFEGDATLGANAAAVLCLQVFQTLRKSAPDARGKRLHFGEGAVQCGAARTPKSHEEAEVLGEAEGAELVVWGRVQRFADDVVVVSYLTLPAVSTGRGERFEQWQVGPIVADPPRRHYALPPIVLSRDLVERYRDPAGLAMFEDKELRRSLGAVGTKFRALEQGPERVRLVRLKDGREGYLPLPKLGAMRSDVIDFVAGVLRIYRADFQGALALMEQVLAEPRVTGELRLDALLYSARCKNILKRRGDEELARAREQNPFDPAVIRYALMMSLSAPGLTPATLRARVERDRYALERDPTLMKSVGQVVELDR